MDSQYSPLTTSTVRMLTDKLYEKRKAAALDIEKQVRDLVSSNQMTQLNRIIDVLNEFVRTQNPHVRKGGLIGLAAISIGLGNLAENYTDKLILPVVECFSDSDSRVRYYACEALYNIVKVTREAVLIHFKLLFDILSKLSTDTDQNVRSGSELLDRLLKDIATSTSAFQAAEFMVLLRERIYTKDANVRRFLVSWLHCLSTVPGMNLLPNLAEVLDGLFQILSDHQLNVREICEAVLGQFLQKLNDNEEDNDLEAMVNVLVVHAQAPDDLVKYTALVWLRNFLQMDGPALLSLASGFLKAIFTCLHHSDDQHRDIYGVAEETNTCLMHIVGEQSTIVQQKLDLDSVINVLRKHLQVSGNVQPRVAVLKWVRHLHRTIPTKMFPYMERLFPILLVLLSDSSDEVVLLDLEVLSDVCNEEIGGSQTSLDGLGLSTDTRQKLDSDSPYFVKFALSLLQIFRDDHNLLHERGSLIIRQLCLLLKPEDIFRSLSVLLAADTDVVFIARMVQTLNSILLTTTELFQLRNQLKHLDSPSSRDLFVCLYRCWSHQPIAVLALCLLSENYSHAAVLIRLFVDIDVTVDFLIEIDRLVQLIESPIFAYMRLHLLDPVHQKHLASVLYGLLMLLPQSEAFHILHRRLQFLPIISGSDIMQDKQSKSPSKSKSSDLIPFDILLKHFQSVQELRRKLGRMQHREMLAKNS